LPNSGVGGLGAELVPFRFRVLKREVFFANIQALRKSTWQRERSTWVQDGLGTLDLQRWMRGKRVAAEARLCAGEQVVEFGAVGG